MDDKNFKYQTFNEESESVAEHKPWAILESVAHRKVHETAPDQRPRVASQGNAIPLKETMGPSPLRLATSLVGALKEQPAVAEQKPSTNHLPDSADESGTVPLKQETRTDFSRLFRRSTSEPQGEVSNHHASLKALLKHIAS